MTVSATSDLAKRINALRTSVSSSSTFQTFTGTATSVLAAAKVYYPGAEQNRPYAVVGVWEGYRVYSEAVGQVWGEGALWLALEQDVATGNQSSDWDAWTAFLNACGGILEDILGSTTSGGLVIKDAVFEVAPARSDPYEENGSDYFFALIRIEGV